MTIPPNSDNTFANLRETLDTREKDINLSTIWKIADGLEISPSELIKEVEKKLDKDFVIE